MQLHNSIAVERGKLAASLSDRARLLCERAKKEAEAGEFEAARATMAEYWDRVGEPPRLDGLDASARAEVLLRVGTLSGLIGSAQQVPGAQEAAKDLITKSATLFEELGLVEKVAEARTDLAICYWREGAIDEARVTLDDAIRRLGSLDSEQRLRAVLNRAIVEESSNRPKDALLMLQESAPLFDRSENHALRGKFHNEYATVLKNLGLAERREEYVDRALIEYAAASFHFEEAGHKRFQGVVENNLGFLFVRLGRLKEAHEHLNRARAAAVALKDQGMIAQVDDTRARAFLDQRQYQEAEAVALGAVRLLEEGGQQSLLAEALITHATGLARLGRSKDALAALTRAMDVAEQAGDLESRGIAALTIIEELEPSVPPTDLRRHYDKAESSLALSQHVGIQSRLGACARRLLRAESLRDQVSISIEPIAQFGNRINQSPLEEQGSASTGALVACSLEEEVLRYEGGLIKRALETSGGSVTRAARLLGVTHQGLAFILNGRHKSLLSARTPVKPRRRSIIRYR